MTSNSSGAASPSAPQEDHRVVQVEIVISWVLRIGVVTSLAVVVVGLALIFAQRPKLWSSPTALQELTRRDAAFPHTLSAVFQGASRTQGQGEAVVAIGLLLLILTPVARVAVSVLAFLYQRDHVFTLITLTVFIILLMSFVIGQAE